MFKDASSIFRPYRPTGGQDGGENYLNDQGTCQRISFCKVVFSVQGTFNRGNSCSSTIHPTYASRDDISHCQMVYIS